MKEGKEGTQTCFDDGTALFAFLAAFLGFAAVRANDGDTSETIRHGWLVRRCTFRVRVYGLLIFSASLRVPRADEEEERERNNFSCK